MGSFLVYTIYSGFVLLILYLLYKLFLSTEKQIGFNRGVLLICYLIAFVWYPLSNLEWNLGTPAVTDHSAVEFGELTFRGISGGVESPPRWPKIVLTIYLAGAFWVLAWTLLSVVRLVSFIRSGEIKNKGEYTLVVIRGESVAPFSFGRYVVMSEEDYESAGRSITMHELAHIRCRHYLDLLLAQAVCVVMWYNPAAWLMREELALIHEYQADASVIDGGADARSYQLLLIRKAVGNRFHTLANSLNHSKLKNRIAMMQKEKSGAMRRMKVVALALAPVLALAVSNIPVVASGLKSIEKVSFLQHSDSQDNMPVINEALIESGTENASELAEIISNHESSSIDREDSATPTTKPTEKDKEVIIAPEEIAMFPGGMDEMMRYLANNIRYPEKAFEENRQGLSVVQFNIEADGSISDVKIVKSAGDDLDEEAIRVVKTMPKWTPAKKDGKDVASEFTLPVNFRLSPSPKQENETTAGSSDEIRVVGYSAIKKEISVTSEEPKNFHIAAEPQKKVVKLDWSNNPPTIFVDGKLYNKNMVDLDPNTIASITVATDSPEYPNGVIYITLK